MKRHLSPLLRPAFWLLLVIALLIILPATAAELTDEELLAMPTVSITYYTMQDGEPLVLDATPALNPLGKAYWAMLPPEAFSYPMTLNITPSETALYTFVPTTGETLEYDINTIDYEGISTLITAYQNEQEVDTYRLYLSTMEMPLAVQPAQVPVYYVDAADNTNVLYSEVVTAYYDQDNLITVDTSLVPANYTLTENTSTSVAITVDEMGIAMPEYVIFSFQEQLMQGTLNIYYQDHNGNNVASPETRMLDPGSYTITPVPSDLLPGYVLSPDSPLQEDITVDDMGGVSLPVVTFFYEPQAVTGYLTVNYVDENEAPLTTFETLELTTQGIHTITPNPALVPAGYVLASPSQVDVTVDQQGGVTPTFVNFIYTAEQVTPAQGDLIIYYTNLNNEPLLNPETRTLEQGQHMVTPNAALVPTGYVLSPPSEQPVTVDANGVVSPASVTFRYDQAQQEPASGTLTAYYQNASGTNIVDPQPQTLTEGIHTIAPNPSVLPEGYAFAANSPASVEVRVDSQGVVSPDAILFICEPVSITGTLTVQYTDENNALIADSETRTLVPGTHTIIPNLALIPAGYTLSASSPSQVDITVDPQGNVSQQVVTFIYTVTQQEPATGTLTIQYMDSVTQQIIASTTASLQKGAHTVAIDESTIPVHYALAEGTPASFPVTVDEYGTVSPDTITFTLTAESGDGYTLIPVESYAATNTSAVNLRSTPDSSISTNVAFPTVETGTQVWVYGTFTLNDREWAFVQYNDTDCYVWNSLIDPVSEAPEPASGTLTVRYLDKDNNPIADDQQLTLDPGAYNITPDPAHVSGDYVLVNDTPAAFEVLVDESGVVSPGTIAFTYAEVAADPTMYPGYTAVEAYAATNTSAVNLRSTPDSSSPANIAFPTVAQDTQVWVHGTFALDDREWAFIQYNDTDCYVWNSLIDPVSEAPEPASGTLTVRYLDKDNNPIADDQQLTLQPGTHSVSPDPAHVPAGYALVETTPAAFEVLVDENGVVSPGTIAFTYAEAAAEAPADPTAYPDYAAVGANAVTNTADVNLRTTPDAASTANIAFPAVAQDTQVWVYGTFTANDTLWAFIHYGDTDCYVSNNLIDLIPETTEPATGTLTVRYLNQKQVPLADDQQLTLEPGTYSVNPDPAHEPEGYTRVETTPAAFEVFVDENGVVSPDTVAFTYAETAAETPGDPEDISGQYADYTLLGTTAVTNDSGVRFRSTPTSASIYNILEQVPQDTEVWVHGKFTNNDTLWAYIRYNNTDCYVWYKLLDVDEASVPVRGSLTVQYHLADGTELADDQILPLEVGTHTITPNASLVPAGYRLTASSPTLADVTVDPSGNVSPDPVTFFYEKEPATGTLTIQYHLADGSEVVADQTMALQTGTHTITPDASLISAEYIPSATSPAQAEVTVDENGKLSLNPVVFTYILNTAAAPPADISGEYADYTVMNVSASTNTTAVNLRSTPNSNTTTNIISKVPLNTAVWAHGSFTIGDRMWAYVRYADVDCYVWYSLLDLQDPVTGTLTVQYRLADGSIVANDQSLTLEAGTHTITPDASLIPAGYLPAASSATQAEVMVDASGTVSPATVTFAYEKEVVTGTLTVQYRTVSGDVVANDQVFTLDVGTHTITPDASLIPTGYTLAASSITQAEVTVAPTGTISPAAAVTFVYDPPVMSGTLTVQYLLGDANVITPLTQTLTPGDYVINVDESLIPEGYALAASSPSFYNVTVSPAGIVSPAVVIFQLSAVETESGLEMYVGYAVTTSQVALRDNANFTDDSILTTLNADTLLYVNGQVKVADTVWTGAQTYLGDSVIGLLPFDAVRTITPGEAQTYIEAYNAAHATVTPSPSPTPTPAQRSGYYLTLGDDVPLRTVPGTQAYITSWIGEDQVVYVNGQVYYDDYTWDISYYGDDIGYIRDDQIRAMTTQEVSAYLAQATPTVTPAVTVEPFDPYATSSYGYVTANSVNFRQTPGGTRMGVLNKYAFGLVLGSQTANGQLWYNINQSGTTGWISGDYFTVMNLSELESFLNSSEYLQGIVNSGTSSSSSSSTSSGSATQGQVSSVEDWNKEVWQNPASGLNASYEPFNPYATPTATIAAETATPEPTATFVIGTMIPISYEDETKETQSGGNWVGLVLGGIVLVGGAGGVYAYALTQSKKRKAAARASAARRSQQKNTVQSNPYARRAAAAPPTAAGQQQKNQNPYQRPNPYTKPPQAPANPYAKPPQQTPPAAGNTPNPYAQRPKPYTAPQPPQGQTAKPPANPYARPQQPAAPQTADTGKPNSQANGPSTQPTQRTGRRSDRYKNQNNDNT